VRDANVEDVIAAIKPAGLANQKGPRIQQVLRAISEERGALNLDFLAGLPVEEARAWLTKFNGVGIAFKVTDGDASRMNDDLESSARVRPAIALEILRQLKALDDAQLKSLTKFGPAKQLKNHRGLVTGESHPVFNLFA